MIHISFDSGTLIISGKDEELEVINSLIKYDERIKMHRAEAYSYEAIIRKLHGKVKYEDNARDYHQL